MHLNGPIVRRSRRHGYSLVELLIVIAIILILAALVAWAFVKIRAVVRSLDPHYKPPTPAAPSPPANRPSRS